MPPKIPTYGMSVSENAQITPYKNASAPTAAFDSTMGLDNLGRGTIYGALALQENREKDNKILAFDKGAEFDNEILKLHDPEKGLFAKNGKAYLDSMDSAMKDLDTQKDKLLEGLDDDQRYIVSRTFENKLAGVKQKISLNAVKEKENYNQQVVNNTINTQTQLAMLNRNDDELIINSVGNINTSIESAYKNNVDNETLTGMKKKATSDLLVSVLQGRIADKSLTSKEFLEQYKDAIEADKLPALTDAVNNVTADVSSRLMADEWLNSGLSEEQAYKKAHAIKDLDLRDQTESKVNQVYGKKRQLEKQAYNDNLDEFWNTYADNPDLNNIPAWMDGKDRITARNYAKQNGGKANPNVESYLGDLKFNNAQEFAKLNLNEFRADLSASDFEKLRKEQKEIQLQGFTQITPDDDAVKSIVETFGWVKKPNEEVISTQMQNIINEEEKRLGRPYQKNEAEEAERRISEWLKYSKEGNSSYVLKQNEAKASFYKGLANDVEFYKKNNNNQMPDADKFRGILYQRANKAIQAHNENIYKQSANTSIPTGKVIVEDKNGNRYYLPKEQLNEALNKGYKKI